MNRGTMTRKTQGPLFVALPRIPPVRVHMVILLMAMIIKQGSTNSMTTGRVGVGLIAGSLDEECAKRSPGKGED